MLRWGEGASTLMSHWDHSWPSRASKGTRSHASGAATAVTVIICPWLLRMITQTWRGCLQIWRAWSCQKYILLMQISCFPTSSNVHTHHFATDHPVTPGSPPGHHRQHSQKNTLAGSQKPFFTVASFRIDLGCIQLPISHLTVIGGFGGRGMVSQSIPKDIRKALTNSLARSAAIFLGQPHGPECGALPRAARRFFQGSPHEPERGAEKKRRRREEH